MQHMSAAQLGRMVVRPARLVSKASHTVARTTATMTMTSSSSSSSSPYCRGMTTSSVRATVMRAIHDHRPINLATLRPAQPTKQRKRVGRGQSSGVGGTAGRGHNGQKSRSGPGLRLGFEGGQTEFIRRMPKFGFRNSFSKTMAKLNLGRIQEWIDAGRLDPTQPITTRELFRSRCIHSYDDGVKILSHGKESLKQPIDVVVSRASRKSIRAIENTGGSVLCKYYTPVTLRYLVKPEKFEGRIPPRDAIPTLRKELVYYSNRANRGFLSERIPKKRPAKKQVAVVDGKVITEEANEDEDDDEDDDEEENEDEDEDEDDDEDEDEDEVDSITDARQPTHSSV